MLWQWLVHVHIYEAYNCSNAQSGYAKMNTGYAPVTHSRTSISIVHGTKSHENHVAIFDNCICIQHAPGSTWLNLEGCRQFKKFKTVSISKNIFPIRGVNRDNRGAFGYPFLTIHNHPGWPVNCGHMMYLRCYHGCSIDISWFHYSCLRLLTVPTIELRWCHGVIRSFYGSVRICHGCLWLFIELPRIH